MAFVLTDEQKRKLEGIGYRASEMKQIERAANGGEYLKEYNTPIGIDEAIALVGEDEFLSGIGRAAFHYTAVRTAPNGTAVMFDFCKYFED